MLKVKKCGITEYGSWVIGTLEYKGLIIKDIFSVNKPCEIGNSYEVENIYISRNSKGELKIKLQII